MIVYPSGYKFGSGKYVKKQVRKQSKTLFVVLQTHLSRVEKEFKNIIRLLANEKRFDLVRETNNQLVSFINLREKVLNEMKKK